MRFSDLGLSAELLRAIQDQGYEQATPIQEKAIPLVIEGRDVLAGAQTGTGKTAGFTLPLLHKLQRSQDRGRRRHIRALILVPTRELAAQVAESVGQYGRHLPFRFAVIFGGVGFNPQAAKLRQGVDIVVATPGRLLDHIQQGTIRLDHVDTLVLDEADRMLDMGFIRDIRRVLRELPPRRQNLLFSATFSDPIRELASEFLHRPAEIQVTPGNATADQVAQVVHPVDRSRKRELLSRMIADGDWRQVLVFTRTKHGANRLSQQLTKDGFAAAAIHGNKSQGARTRALADFKSGRARVLVATDIAARGLDIDRLPHVVNYELPNVPEDYVHRIGRTGRAGREGEAVSLVCVDEKKLLSAIERLLGRRIRQQMVTGFEPDPSILPEPIFKGRGQRQGHGRNNGQAAGRNGRGRGGRGQSPGRGQGPGREQERSQDGRGQRGQRSQGGQSSRRSPASDRSTDRSSGSRFGDSEGRSRGGSRPSGEGTGRGRRRSDGRRPDGPGTGEGPRRNRRRRSASRPSR